MQLSVSPPQRYAATRSVRSFGVNSSSHVSALRVPMKLSPSRVHLPGGRVDGDVSAGWRQDIGEGGCLIASKVPPPIANTCVSPVSRSPDGFVVFAVQV